VEYWPNTNINNIICKYKYTKNLHPKVGLVAETKEGRKEGEKRQRIIMKYITFV
jgi:hypothetical protein